MSPTMPWAAEALWQALEPLCPGLSVEVVAQTGSTSTDLLERVRQGRDLQPCLLVAERQTAGRGRQGKAWHAEPGASLTFSLSLPYAPAGAGGWSGLSLAVGLAVAEALEPLASLAPQQRPRLGLKWPNDLLLAGPDAGSDAGPDDLGRKLGGILIETVPVGSGRQLVLGIGLNLATELEAAPGADLPWGRAAVHSLLPGLGAPELLARLAPPLLQALRDFERQGFAPLQPAFARRDRLLGRTVSTTLAEPPGGVADGVDAQGLLWLRVGEGRDARRLPLHSGEVSLRLAGSTA
ncbi:MAG: biotin--[acetyl-CoA-carboxylase] ligase [Burkholderiaceae bacterium]|nr:biotin--[acetyl-CoA-carboxylase] ligase [Burkholderiaceae bacterium]